jgi:FAD-dependent urate hydroxylase
MANVRTAMVIGCGIAGPVTAMALRRASIDATVYEAYDRPADGIGGVIAIAANGQNALRVLDADDAIRDIGIPTPRMVLESYTGKRLATFSSPPGLPVTQTVPRAEMYRAMCDAATGRGIRVEHGKRLISADEDPNGVTARFADGSSAQADILVGADGVRSTVRSLIDPNAPEPTYVGLVGCSGWAPNRGFGPADGTVHVVFGRRAFFGYMVVTDGRVGWWVSVPSREPLTGAEMKETDGTEWLRRYGELFADDGSLASGILRAADPGDLVFTGAAEYLPDVPTWHRGRMVLVGDSAHAPSPNSGQGASLAIEDGIQLVRCLRDLPTVAEAFAWYENIRRPRVLRIIADTERANRHRPAGGFGRVLRDLLLPVAVKLLANPGKAAWQFDYRIDWDAPVGPASAGGAA